MNPHLRFGQGIAGICDGRGIGIIDTREFNRITESTALLQGSAAWTEQDQRGLREWCQKYLAWLLESDLGKDEQREPNNHGTWYDLQVVVLALFAGQEAVARRVLEGVADRRIAAQVQPDGRQPKGSRARCRCRTRP